MNTVIRVGHWEQLGAAARVIRQRVFVAEQRVPRELELDDLDERCIHAVSFVAGVAVGTARLTEDGHIGRMAVLRGRRGQGIGTRLLTALLARARADGLAEVALNAQVQAIPFYERQGFVALGPVFEDAGIPHRRMQFRLSPFKV